jgi:hypothetical protein
VSPARSSQQLQISTSVHLCGLLLPSMTLSGREPYPKFPATTNFDICANLWPDTAGMTRSSLAALSIAPRLLPKPALPLLSMSFAVTEVYFAVTVTATKAHRCHILSIFINHVPNTAYSVCWSL